MSKGKIIVLSGPSGSGKTTLQQKLLASEKFKNRLFKSISVTTRPMRLNEQKGRDYLFISQEEFAKKIKSGEFLEWECVFGNYYGTPKNNVENLLVGGKNVLLCIDVKGAATVSRLYPDAVKIFVTAPTLFVLKDRLIKRGTENQESIESRIETAKIELQEAKNYKYVVVNDDLDITFNELEKILSIELNKS